MALQGLQEVLRGFDNLVPLLQRKVMTRVMRAGGRPVLARARSKIHSRSGRLARSGRISVRMRDGQAIARIAFGKNVSKDDPFWAVFVERGTRPHEIRPRNRKSLFIAGLFAEVIEHPGAEPHPFLLPALEEMADAALAAMQAELADGVEELGGLA